MVMPLRDDDTDRRTTPVVTYALIAVNVLVWLIEMNAGDRFINGYSTVPFEITHGTDLVGAQTISAGGESASIQLYPGPTPIYLTYITAQVKDGKIAYMKDIYGWDAKPPQFASN